MATVAWWQTVSSTARRSRRALSAPAARASAACRSTWLARRPRISSALSPGGGLVRHRVGELDLLLAEPARRPLYQDHHGAHHPRESEWHVQQARRVEAHRELARDDRRAWRVGHVERLAGLHHASDSARPVEADRVLLTASMTAVRPALRGCRRPSAVGGELAQVDPVDPEDAVELGCERTVNGVAVRGVDDGEGHPAQCG